MNPAPASTWPINRILQLDLADGRRERAALRRRMAALATHVALARAIDPVPQPFFLVSPLGLMRRQMLATQLSLLGITIESVARVASWPLVSTALYLQDVDDDRLRIALAFERLWVDLFPRGSGERWQLHDAAGHRRLLAARGRLRQSIPSLALRVSTRTHTFEATLPALHVPDVDQLHLDAARLGAVARHGESLRTDCDAATRGPARSRQWLPLRS
ncbi:MAG: hypothetical protein U1E76_00055 [Planctomycetota bacterium]